MKQLNEDLENLILAFQLNEMAIYYGTDHGTVDDVIQGFRKLADLQEGMFHINQYLCVSKPVTQKEIDLGLFEPIQKGVAIDRKYPIVLVWGEKDKTRGNRRLQGHGISHILQGHRSQATQVFNKLSQVDKYGNYTIKLNNYRFAFILVDKEDGTPDHAVLITAFIRN